MSRKPNATTTKLLAVHIPSCCVPWPKIEIMVGLCKAQNAKRIVKVVHSAAKCLRLHLDV